jgi:hypothetical protein
MRISRKGLTERQHFEILAASDPQGTPVTPLAMQPKVLEKTGRRGVSDNLTVKQRRARIDFFKSTLANLPRSGLSTASREESKVIIQDKIKEEKYALLNGVVPDDRGIYKLGSKYYIKVQAGVKGGTTKCEYIPCDKDGAPRISAFPSFFCGDKVQAHDLLCHHPGRYLIRDINSTHYMLCYSNLDGDCHNLLISKNNHRRDGTANGETIGESIDALHKKGVYGYYKGLECLPPTAFFNGGRQQVNDFLARRPDRYVIAKLNRNECVISYLDDAGQRQDMKVKSSNNRGNAAKSDMTIGEAIEKLHGMKRVGYYPGVDAVPPPVPKWVDVPPPPVPAPF